MLGQRLRRWPNIAAALDQRLVVFAGMGSGFLELHTDQLTLSARRPSLYVRI